jgi:hypothetical protein
MFLLHCHADDKPVHHLSIMTSIKPCETSMPMFLKLGMDLSHGSMVAMKHFLLIYLSEAQFGPIFYPMMIRYMIIACHAFHQNVKFIHGSSIQLWTT